MNLKNKFLYQYLREYYLKLKVKINPEKEVDRCYYQHFRKHINLKEPHNLIEKIFWMELNADTSLWTLCADKYRVREYIDNKGLSIYMPKLYGHWDKVDEIDFDLLPKQFVIKVNNGCGSVKIVRDKSLLNVNALKKELRQWLIIPYGWAHAQLHYTRIKPCIIAEELLTNDFESISPGSLVDYKVWCINGDPQFIWVAYNRKGLKVNMQAYDPSWKPCPHILVNTKNDKYDPQHPLVAKPECLDEMLNISRKISSDFPQIRVDFYIANGKPVIGELTLSTGYGYFTMDTYKKMGEMIDLRNVEKVR